MKISADKLRLYAVTDSAWLNGRSLAEVVREAIEGGATVVQYREKNKDHDDMLKEAREVCAVCREYGVPFIMNDSVEIAIAVDADGVHLGLDDGDLKAARELLGEGKIIGASTHNVQEALSAQAQGADYLGCGAVFGSTTKTDISSITPEILAQVTSAVQIPVVAIGGINRDNISLLNGCSLAGAAVVSAIFAQKDIRAAAKEMRALAEKL